MFVFFFSFSLLRILVSFEHAISRVIEKRVMMRTFLLFLFVTEVVSTMQSVTPTDAACANENDAFDEDDCLTSNGERRSGICETCFDEEFLRTHFDITSPPNGKANGEIVMEVHNWLGHRVVAQMLRILLQEIYGYVVQWCSDETCAHTHSLFDLQKNNRYKITMNYYTDPGNSIARVSGGCSHLNNLSRPPLAIYLSSGLTATAST